MPQLSIVVGLTRRCSASSPASAWVTGNTLLGLEVPDEVRGRTFAFVASLIRLALALVLAAAPLRGGPDRAHGFGPVDGGEPTVVYNGAAVTFLLAAVLMSAVGVVVLSSDGRPEGRPRW